MKFKEKDVFRFRYNEAETKKGYDLYHCFDGILITKTHEDGEIYLEDTYWSSNSRSFSTEEVLRKGTLEYMCNLNEMTSINSAECKYYDNIVELPIHKGYRTAYLVAKDEVRSPSKILSEIQEQIETKTRKIASLKFDIERLHGIVEEVKKGKTDVYF
jgi:hypothetical protein